MYREVAEVKEIFRAGAISMHTETSSPNFFFHTQHLRQGYAVALQKQVIDDMLRQAGCWMSCSSTKCMAARWSMPRMIHKVIRSGIKTHPRALQYSRIWRRDSHTSSVAAVDVGTVSHNVSQSNALYGIRLTFYVVSVGIDGFLLTGKYNQLH